LSRRALAIYAEEPAAALKDWIETSGELGYLLVLRGKYAEAEPLLRRSVDFHEKFPEADNRDLSDVLVGLARLYLKQNKAAEAEPVARRALALHGYPVQHGGGMPASGMGGGGKGGGMMGGGGTVGGAPGMAAVASPEERREGLAHAEPKVGRA